MTGSRFNLFLRENLAKAIQRANIYRPLILMDNLLAHFTAENIEFMTTNNWGILPQPTHS